MEQDEKTVSRGPGPGPEQQEWRLTEQAQAQGCGAQPPTPPVPHTCSHSRSPGCPDPEPPSSSPGLPWLRSIGAQLPQQRELLAPVAPTSLPSPEETALLIKRPRSAPQQRK